MKKLVASIFISCFAFYGQTQSLELVMDNYFKAIGGKEKVDQIKATKEVSFNWLKHKLSGNSDSTKGIKTQTILKEPFYKNFVSFDSKGNWSNEFYYNEKGSVLAMGSIVQKGKDRIQISLSLSSDLLKWYQSGILEYLGKDKLKGNEYDVVRKMYNGKAEHFFFNASTYLLEASKNQDWPDRLTYYSEYKKTSLILHPFLLETYEHDILVYRQISESFEYNPEINDQIFYFNEKEYEKRNRPKVKYESVKLEVNATNLNDLIQTNFKDKKVFVDMWATWCGPCKKEFREYDSAYYAIMDTHGIDLLYLSIDKDTDKKNWERDIEKLSLKGYHARANKKLVESLQTEIFDGKVITIPRYILINETGKVLSNNFLRPSDPEFKKRLNEILDNR